VGRKLAYNACLAVLFSLTIGAAVAPNMPVFVTMRVMSGFQGCYFHVAGQTIIAEYFPPVSTPVTYRYHRLRYLIDRDRLNVVLPTASS
jgi:MFS family permease